MPEQIDRERGRVAVEVSSAVLFAVVLVISLRSALVTGETTIIHDNLYWYLPVYHFFLERILNGEFPYWNPFSHGGEPLYPALLQLRLLDPSVFLTGFVGKLFTSDLGVLFVWDRIVRALIAALGSYLLLRQWTPYLLVRISLFPILLWSSFLLTSLRQAAMVDQFIYAPFAAYFLFRILDRQDNRWVNWLGLAIAVGLSWQSYFFTGMAMLIPLILIGFLLFRRGPLSQIINDRGTWWKMAGAAAIVVVMAWPNVVVFLERGDYHFTARQTPQSVAPLDMLIPADAEQGEATIVMSYGLVRKTGAFSVPWDWVQMIAPAANGFRNPDNKYAGFGNPSEAFIYFGMLVYCGALFGLLAGQHRLKRVWLIILAGFGFLILGPNGGLHWLLYYVYPPIWFLRNTHGLVNFFGLALLYFYILGANRFLAAGNGIPLFSSYPGKGLIGRTVPSPDLGCVVSFGLFVAAIYFLGTAVLGKFTLYPEWIAGMALPPMPLPLLFGAGLMVGYGLRRDLGTLGIFWGVVLAHLLLVLTYTNDAAGVLVNFGLFLYLPLCVVFLPRGTWPFFLRRAIPGTVMLFLVTDLFVYLQGSYFLWSGVRPDSVDAISVEPLPAKFPKARRVIPPADDLPDYEQPLRYVEVASRTASVLPGLKSLPSDPQTGISLEEALRARQANFFYVKRDFADLINSGLDSRVLEELFAVNRPLIQFREKAFLVTDEKFTEIIGALPADEAVRMVQEQLFLSQDVGTALVRMDRSEYAAVPQEFRWSLTGYDYNTLELATKTSVPGFLYFADGYDPYWNAFVDGEPVPVLRANGVFKALPLDAGMHTVRLAYDPALFRFGLYAFYGAPRLFILLTAASVLRRSRAPSHPLGSANKHGGTV